MKEARLYTDRVRSLLPCVPASGVHGGRGGVGGFSQGKSGFSGKGKEYLKKGGADWNEEKSRIRRRGMGADGQTAKRKKNGKNRCALLRANWGNTGMERKTESKGLRRQL